MIHRKQKSGDKNRRLKRVFEMQRAGIRPVQLTPATWSVASQSEPGKSYTLRVWLARDITHIDSIGAALDLICPCRSRVECKHILAVRLEYNRDASLLFRLVGVDESAGFNELLMMIERRKAVAA